MRHRLARLVFQFFIALFFTVVAIAAPNRSPDGRIRRGEHVVVVVWDGMRPDFVGEQNTPALWKLAQTGVTFTNHHCVFPSATIVNGTAINTGVYPDRDGILDNHDFKPEIDPKNAVDVETARVVRKGDEVSGGHCID